MTTKINLLSKVKPKKDLKKAKSLVLSGTVLLFLLGAVAAISVTIYAQMLTRQSNVLASEITSFQQKIDSLKPVEEKKSILTVKTKKLQEIYAKRFDYLQALDDVQRLFGYSLSIENISISADGVVTVSGKKEGVITISEQEALNTNIKQINLHISIPNSVELQRTVDILKTFQGKGLKSAKVTQTSLNEGGEYDVTLELLLGPLDQAPLPQAAPETSLAPSE